MTNILILLKKELILTKRSFTSVLVGVGIPLAFFLFFSTLWGSDATMSSQEVSLYTTRYLFSMTAFSSLSFALLALPAILKRDRSENRFRLLRFSPVTFSQYYVSKVLRVLVYFLIAIVVVFFVGHVVKGVDLPLKTWVEQGGLLLFGAATFMPLGVLLSALKSEELLSSISNMLYIGLAALGGLWMPVQTFPDWLQKIAKLTPTYHFDKLLTDNLNGTFATDSALYLIGFAVIIVVIVVLLNRKMTANQR